jgi:hypothetical protein
MEQAALTANLCQARGTERLEDRITGLSETNGQQLQEITAGTQNKVAKPIKSSGNNRAH